MPKPLFILVGGPNGAGKSTLGQAVVKVQYKVENYLNADFIARGLVGLRKEERDIAAGKTILNLIKENFSLGKSFAVESTLSSNVARRWVTAAKDRGFRVVVLYYYLRTPGLAVQRVAKRVKRGGHDISKEIILRRYKESLKQLREFYVVETDDLIIFDNSSKKPNLIASKKDAILNIAHEKDYQRIFGKR